MKQIEKAVTDPLQDPAFKAPGLGEKLRDAFLGRQRPLDCVQIEVTSVCRGKCIYCPHTTQASDWKSRHMGASVFAAIWPFLRNSQRAHLQGWGEPLAHPRFFDFAHFARRAGCEVSTTSSGLKMDMKTAESILESGMDLIAFSLAGTDERSNAARSGIEFATVCGSIKFLREVIKKSGKKPAPEIHIAYLMLADRMDAASALPELMDELDVDMAVVSTLDYLAAREHAELAFAPGEAKKIDRARKILEKAATRADEAGRILHYALPGEEAIAIAGGCRENVAKSLYVDADGVVSPCVYLNVPGNDPSEKRRIFGNVADGDPWSVWKSENFINFRKGLLQNRPDPACHACPKRFEKNYGTGA